ncbi:UNVERIFIED_CONTAM: hypothetical protein C3P00_19385, partial [Clostridioides difficile]
KNAPDFDPDTTVPVRFSGAQLRASEVKRGNIIPRQLKRCNTYKDCEQFGWVSCCCAWDGPNDGYAGRCVNKFLAPCEPACKQL